MSINNSYNGKIQRQIGTLFWLDTQLFSGKQDSKTILLTAVIFKNEY